MKDWIISVASEGIGRGIASIILMPIMLPLAYFALKMFLWSAEQWVEMPTLTNGQILVVAMGIVIFGR